MIDHKLVKGCYETIKLIDDFFKLEEEDHRDAAIH